MNKTELINNISDKSGLTKEDTELFLNSYIEIIEKTIENGDEVQIVGFGTFETEDTPEREGHNPITDEYVIIPANKSVKFRIGKAFKDRINAK